MKRRPGITIPTNLFDEEIIDEYSDEELGQLFRAIFKSRVFEQEQTDLNRELRQLLRTVSEFDEVSKQSFEKMQKGGQKGGQKGKVLTEEDKPDEAPLSPLKPLRQTETETEIETEIDNSVVSNDTMSEKSDDVVRMFNTICTSYPQIKSLTSKRKGLINGRFHEGHTLEDFKQVFTNMEQSSFLKGQNRQNFQATFDWVIRPNNFAKTLEGNYNRASPPQGKDSELMRLYKETLNEGDDYEKERNGYMLGLPF